MPTQAKAEKIEELTDKLGRATVAVLVQTQGLNIKGMNEFRSKLRAAKIDLQVVKNTLLRIASERNGMSLDKKIFDGQTTVAFGYEDEVAAVKAVSEYVQTSKIVTIKSAILGKRALSQKQVEDLSKISGGKKQVRAEVVGALQAPLTNFYSTLTAPLRDFCYVLQARIDQLNSGQATVRPIERGTLAMTVTDIIAEIETKTVLELVEMTKTIQEKWGVSAAPVAAVAAAPVAGPVAEAAPAAEEKTEFDAILTDVGANKINVIKVVRELTGLGLKEAKAVVDEAPKPIKEAVSKEEAEKIAAKMAEVGAKVTIK